MRQKAQLKDSGAEASGKKGHKHHSHPNLVSRRKSLHEVLSGSQVLGKDANNRLQKLCLAGAARCPSSCYNSCFHITVCTRHTVLQFSFTQLPIPMECEILDAMTMFFLLSNSDGPRAQYSVLHMVAIEHLLNE